MFSPPSMNNQKVVHNNGAFIAMDSPPYHYYIHNLHSPTIINTHTLLNPHAYQQPTNNNTRSATAQYWASHTPFPHQQQTHTPISNLSIHRSSDYQEQLHHPQQHPPLSLTQHQTHHNTHSATAQQPTQPPNSTTDFLLNQLFHSQQTTLHNLQTLVHDFATLNANLAPSLPTNTDSLTLPLQHITKSHFNHHIQISTTTNMQPQNDFIPQLPIINLSSSQPILDPISPTISISPPQQQHNFTSPHSQKENQQSLSERELTLTVIPPPELPPLLLVQSLPPPCHVVFPADVDSSLTTTHLNDEGTKSSLIPNPTVTIAVVEESVFSKSDGKSAVYIATRFVRVLIFDSGGDLVVFCPIMRHSLKTAPPSCFSGSFSLLWLPWDRGKVQVSKSLFFGFIKCFYIPSPVIHGSDDRFVYGTMELEKRRCCKRFNCCNAWGTKGMLGTTVNIILMD